MNLPKNIIRAMAEAERLMDEGKLQWVMAPSPNGMLERLPVPDDVMENLGLKNGQKINTMIHDAILKEMLKVIIERLQAPQDEDIEESLDEEFDFRTMMGEDNDNSSK